MLIRFKVLLLFFAVANLVVIAQNTHGNSQGKTKQVTINVPDEFVLPADAELPKDVNDAIAKLIVNETDTSNSNKTSVDEVGISQAYEAIFPHLKIKEPSESSKLSSVFNPMKPGDSHLVWFNSAKADNYYSKVGGDGLDLFRPEQAIKRSINHWLSSGNAANKDIVSFIGELITTRLASGLLVNWANTPHEVRVMASNDGIEFFEAAGWTTNRLASKEMEQKIWFKKPYNVQVVKIEMRGQLHNFFGINFVALLAPGYPILQLTSGITASSEEYCWQVERGAIAEKGAEIVLSSCFEAIAAGDSRELWTFDKSGKIMNPISKLCMQLKDNDPTNGGVIVIDDCSKAKSGSGIWELLPNNELRLMRGGNLCLSAKGDQPGAVNVALNSAASASSIRNGEPVFSPGAAVDGKLTTFWASDDYAIENVPEVYFTVDFGTVTKIQDLWIEWQYPASSFEVELSTDGLKYESVISVSNNGLKRTVYTMDGQKGRFLKIKMIEAGPVLGIVAGRAIFGISQLRVYSNMLPSIIDDCMTAKNNKDGRESIFPVPVDVELIGKGVELKAQNMVIKNRLEELQKNFGSLSEILPFMENCRSTAKSRENNLISQTNRMGQLSEALNQLTYDYSLDIKYTKPLLGDSDLFPAEDCMEIMKQNKSAINGFYWIRPFCAPHSIRVYCDMTTGASLHPILTKVSSPRAVSSTCAAIGLKPIVIRDSKTISSLKKMASLMGVTAEKKRIIPLAHDFDCENGKCSGSFLDLGQQKEQNSVVTKSLISESIKPETVLGMRDATSLGINADGVTAFSWVDSFSTDIVVCSPNTDINHSDDAINLDCKSRFIDVKSLSSATQLSSILVKCPITCNTESGVVIGSDVYRDDSSICLAAIHAGTLGRSGIVQITPIEGLSAYGSTKRNGVSSIQYQGKKWKKSFVTAKYERVCPKDDITQLLSFLQVDNTEEETEFTVQKPKSLSPILSGPLDTAGAISRVYRILDSLAGVEGGSLVAAVSNARLSISQARAILKPTEIMDIKTRSLSDTLYGKAVETSSMLWYHMENIIDTLEEQNNLQNQAAELRSSQTGFSSWKIPESSFGAPIVFGKYFEQFDSPGTVDGTGSWKYLYEPIGDRTAVLGQTSLISAGSVSENAVGTYARLKYKRFYDFDFTTDIYLDGSGSGGIAFRMQSISRMYLFELKQRHGASKRLLRISDGVITELARRNDGGYVSQVWYSFKAEIRGPRITIYFGRSGENISKIFDFYDSTFSSGSIGFFSSGMNGVYFDQISVMSKPCVHKALSIVSSPPTAPVCSTYKSELYGGVRNEWIFVDPEDFIDGPSQWEFKDGIGGVRKALTQTSNIKSQGSDGIGTHAILGGNRSCRSGVFEFSFFPQCTSGMIGGLIHYTSPSFYVVFEMGSYFSRIRAIVDGAVRTIASNVLVGYQMNSWNNIEISFGPTGVAVSASTNGWGKTQLLYSGSPLGVTGGSIGLSSYGCPGVAFKDINLKPMSIGQVLKDVFIDTTEKVDETALKEGSCLANNHFSQRMSHCSELGRSEDEKKLCQSNYCSYCCENNVQRTTQGLVKCKESCHKNDIVTEKTNAILNSLQLCHQTDALKVYDEGCDYVSDAAAKMFCIADMCSMCCTTQPVVGKDGKRESIDDISRSECTRQCLLMI